MSIDENIKIKLDGINTKIHVLKPFQFSVDDSMQEIRRAFKQWCLSNHPDKLGIIEGAQVTELDFFKLFGNALLNYEFEEFSIRWRYLT